MTQERMSIRAPLPRSAATPEEAASPRIRSASPSGEESAPASHAESGEELGPDPAALAAELVGLLGAAPLMPLAENPFLRPPQEDASSSPSVEQWLEGLLKSFVSREGIEALRRNLHAGILDIRRENEALRQELEQAGEREQEHENRVLGLERRMADLDQTIHKNKETLSRSLEVSVILDRMDDADKMMAGMTAALREALRNPSPEIGPFAAAVWAEWPAIKQAAAQEMPEDERIEQVGAAVRRLLANVRGMYFPERRDVLKCLATAISSGFRDYVFMSPEDRRHVDPSVHNALGVGGDTVKEGLSFAVLRSSSGQPVIYADIIAE